MGALGLIGKDSKKFYDLLKMTLKLEKDQTNYLIKKVRSCCIRTTYKNNIYFLQKGQIMG